MPAKVIVRNLSKRYGGVEAVRGVSFEIEAGEIFGLLGPNGAGKTTTLECLVGLREADAGELKVCGLDARKHPQEVKQRIGVALQSTALQDKITPREALKLFGSFYRERAEPAALLARFALTEKADARFDTLSGGQRQRLALALAFVNTPELVLLDEPTTGLDPQARHVIWERLRNLLKQGKTLLLTTHFMEEAERLCSRIAIMDHGKIISGGDPRALITQHVEPHVVEVYGEGAPGWGETFGRRHAERCEATGETIFCYTSDPAPLVADLDSRGDLRYLHRRANIEDVFLKLTGRDLRD